MGRDASGIPFYVMRFVEGPTLEESIREFHARDWPDPGERNKSFRDLLGHFLAASAAVAYAHGQGVLHRDLKPSNVVVGPLNQAVVLDWGLGKSPSTREEKRPDETSDRADSPTSDSATQGRMGTAGYMSPEQQAGDWCRVGPWSDVFSLGVTLYFLLTGKPPFAGRSGAEVMEKVENGTFQPPRQRDPTIPQALEAICVKAMAHRPEDRYPTALEFVEDLKSWMADEPVAAAPERLYHRWGRALRRHRSATAASFVGLLVVAVVATAAAFWISRARAGERRARERSETRLNLAMQAIGQFRQVVDENVDVQAQPDLKPLRMKLLEEPLKFYQDLRQDLEDSGSADANARARLSLVMIELAMTTAKIGTTGRAIEDFEAAIANLEGLTSHDPEDQDGRLLLARGHGELAMLRRAEGATERAREHLERARNLLERLTERDPNAPLYRGELIRVLDKLALLDLSTRPERSQEILERAIDLERGLLEKNPNKAKTVRSDLARLYIHIGMLHRAADRHDRAEASYQEAITILETLVVEDPDEALYRENLASAHYNLGNLRCRTRRPGGRANLERARALDEALLLQRPAVSSYRAGLARTLGSIAILDLFRSRPDEARTGFERARDLFEELARDNPTVSRHRVDLITTYEHLISLWKRANRPEKVVECLRRSRTLLEGLVRESPSDKGLQDKLVAVTTDLAKADGQPDRVREAPNAFPEDVFVR
jgi:tetratricopeptide (TPR) repeat protein